MNKSISIEFNAKNKRGLSMQNHEASYNKAIYTFLRIGFVALILYWSFKIVEPFVMPTVWGIIIAVALYPLHKKLSKLLNGKEKLSAVIITLVTITLLVVPSLFFINSTVDGMQDLATRIRSGQAVIPVPPEKVANWPMIGKPIYDIWLLFSQNLDAAVVQFSPQLKNLAQTLISAASGLGMTLLLFIVSIIIAGVFLVKAKSSEAAARSIFRTLIGKYGEDFVSLSGAIIRSVLQGVLMVAAVQALLGGIGIALIGIPAAGLWAIIILLLAIMQLPPLLILGPLAIYSFTIADTTPAIIFTVWSLAVSVSDAFLKPLFLGRGVDVPMLAVLLGAIGGMIYSGIIGLFVGAVVLTLTYKVFEALLVKDIFQEDPPAKQESI
jgi:predicted PurR-regulated permease PerM